MADGPTLDLPLPVAAEDDTHEYIRTIFDREMGVTLHNYRAGSSRDKAMKALTQEAANLYAKRVLRELIQNAFDGAAAAEAPRILLRLDLQRGPHGVLYVANNGDGFTRENVDAVVNPAMSNKTPGNFIGHKGLGFRSVELLSDDVEIVSMQGEGALDAPGFDGFRFRFARPQDEAAWLQDHDAAEVADQVVGRVHRLQLPVPLASVGEDVTAFAGAGYATVVRLPLRDATAAARAEEELRLLFDEKAPITLFLHRLASLTIERLDETGRKTTRSLSRRARPLTIAACPDDLILEEVTVDKGRFLVARKATDEARFRKSIEASVAQRQPVERWRDWKGAPTVSVALPLTPDAAHGAYYAFLPTKRVAPFAGCLDAPFYPEADRRDLDLAIPLNGFLLDEVAGLCLSVAGALAASNETRPDLAAAAIDAVAWTDEAQRMLDACGRVGVEVGALRLPAMRRAETTERWARLDEIYDWDDKAYRVLQRNLLVKVCDLPMLPARLGERRTENLAAFVEETEFQFDPAPESWRTWAAAIAGDLARRKKLVRADWEGFYADLATMSDVLPQLRGAVIFRLEDGTLAAANGATDSDGSELFISAAVEMVSRRRRRVEGASRIPPGSIARKMRFADPLLAWPQHVAEPFIKAQLATDYSLARVLARLGTMIGKRPKRVTVIAALGWAFQAWSEHRSPDVEQALKLANLPIPVEAGVSRLPTLVYFGAGWRDTRGDLLREFLDAAPSDARTLRHLRDGLLPSWDAWPLKDRGSVAEWVLFLRHLGVNDGLKPIRYAALKRSIYEWVQFMSEGTDGPQVEGVFGDTWRRSVRRSKPWEAYRYQSGSYETGSVLWGLPGQAEHATMTPEAKLAFARLLVPGLAELTNTHFSTTLSRSAGNADELTLPSPVAAFLRLAEWLPVSRGDEVEWRTPSTCWFAPRAEPLPRFVPPIERGVRDALEASRPAQDVAVARLGLRLWTSPDSALERLESLGDLVARGVPEAEHDAFRKACREAWELWAAHTPRAPLPTRLTLAVLGDGKPRALPLAWNDTGRDAVFVSDSTDPMREQLIAALGHLVLPLPERIAPDVAAALAARFGGGFPLLADAGLTIRCDGIDFVPSAGAGPLVGPGQEWLAEIAVLVLEFNEGLSNRNTLRSRQSLYDDFRKLRIAFARHIEVEVEGRVGDLPSILDRVLAVPDDDNPTLLVEAASSQVDWPLLARVSRALPMALARPSLAMAFRVAFLAIAQAQVGKDGLARPTDEDIALALGHSLTRVQEVYRSLRSTTQRLFESLVPVTEIFLGSAAAQAVLQKEHVLLEDAEIAALLRQEGADPDLATRLVETCRSGEGIDEVRRALGVDLAVFNQALARLGPPWQPLSFEARLKGQFAKRKEARRAELEGAVRDAFVDVFDAGSSLERYIELRALEWIAFQDGWVEDLDDLPDDTIDAVVGALGASTLPSPAAKADGALDDLRQRNRALLIQAFEGLRLLPTAWVAKHAADGAMLPAIWGQSAEEAGRSVVASGALDFRLVAEVDLPQTFLRAGLWPAAMPASTDLDALDLTKDDIRRRAVEDEQAKLDALKLKRSITFGAETIDGGGERPFQSVAQTLQASLTSKAFATRSGKADLLPFPEGGPGGGGPGGRKRGREPEYMSEEQRFLLGFAGELAAYTHLKRTVRGFADAYWVSSMGRRYLGLTATPDDDGFDFHIPRSRGPDLYFEVKAHRGDPGYVDLERSQVASALSMADGRQGLWAVLYVPFVTNPDLIAVHELQNPFSKESETLYREVGKRAVRLEMKRG